MKALLTLVVLAVLVGGGWYLYHKNGKGNMAESASTPAPEASATGSAMPAGTVEEDGVLPEASSTSAVKQFDVAAANYSFTPKTITVNKGDTVKITVTNQGGFHDFKIDEFNVSTQRLASGKSETVTFVADKAGTFQYYCSVGNHRAMGMWGTLTVNG